MGARPRFVERPLCIGCGLSGGIWYKRNRENGGQDVYVACALGSLADHVPLSQMTNKAMTLAESHQSQYKTNGGMRVEDGSIIIALVEEKA